jgi:segregation and condensation protein B
MTSSPEPPFAEQPRGISLDELSAAFAEVMGVEPRRGQAAAESAAPSASAQEAIEAGPVDVEQSIDAESASVLPEEQDPCPICPRTIFEAMLFVGDREGKPLSPRRAAELMRDVAVDEVPALVLELNRRYAATGSPLRVVGDGDGYRLTLQSEYRGLRRRFQGKMREARLSQAAIDVLALVAYQQPIAGEKINRLRGKPSNHVLALLVRRGLLRIERPQTGRRVPLYYTTDRFLRLFGLDSLADLPQSDDPSPP